MQPAPPPPGPDYTIHTQNDRNCLANGANDPVPPEVFHLHCWLLKIQPSQAVRIGTAPSDRYLQRDINVRWRGGGRLHTMWICLQQNGLFGIENLLEIGIRTDLTTREAVQAICTWTGLRMPDEPPRRAFAQPTTGRGPEPDAPPHGVRVLEAFSLMHRRLARLERCLVPRP